MNTFNARIAQIFDKEFFTSNRDGAQYVRQRILLETVEQYPQQMVVTLTGNLADDFNRQVGDTVMAYINFKVHPNKDNTAYFNDIYCWRLD